MCQGRNREIEVRKDNAHPCGDDAPGRDDPGLGLVVVWWGEPPLGDPREEPGESVDEDVGDDAGDDAVCDAIGRMVRSVAKCTPSKSRGLLPETFLCVIRGKEGVGTLLSKFSHNIGSLICLIPSLFHSKGQKSHLPSTILVTEP